MIIFKENKKPNQAPKKEAANIAPKANILDVLNQTKIRALYIFTTALQKDPVVAVTSPSKFTSSAARGITFNSNDGLVMIRFDESEFQRNGAINNKGGIIEYVLYFNKAGYVMAVT
jgi:hypothetical protein